MNSNRWMQIAEEPLLRILGPLFLVGAIGAASLRGSVDLALIGVGALGLFLCAKWDIRGFCYAFAILFVASVVHHIWRSDGNHWLRLGFEGTIGSAFLLTALAFEEGKKQSNAFLEQIEAKKQTISNLEEDLLKKQEELSTELVAAGDRYTTLQRQLEEVQTEAASFQVLNEVLRRQSAKLTLERDHAAMDRLDLERRVGEMQAELETKAQEISRIRNTDALKQQNEELFKELNEARVREEQTKLINETLVRIHAKESAELEILEKTRMELREQLQMKEGEIVCLEERCEQLFSKGASSSELLLKLEGEKEFFKDRLEKLQPDFEMREMRIGALEQQLAHLQGRISETAGIEGLYRQLRVQFQEKDQQLQHARAERFKAETEAQTLQQRVVELETAPESFSADLRKELERVEADLHAASEENLVLEGIITSLSAVKKKESTGDGIAN